MEFWEIWTETKDALKPIVQSYIFEDVFHQRCSKGNIFTCVNDIHTHIFKLRLGALIPMSVCLSVCLSVGRSVYLPVLQNLQNFTKPLKTLEKVKKRVFFPPPPPPHWALEHWYVTLQPK